MWVASTPKVTLWTPDESACGGGMIGAAGPALVWARQLSKAYGGSIAPSANTPVPPSVMPTCSRAQHSEKSRTPTHNAASHLNRGQCKATLKGSVLHCNHRDWQLDYLQLIAIPQCFPVNGVQTGFYPDTAMRRHWLGLSSGVRWDPHRAGVIFILFFPFVIISVGALLDDQVEVRVRPKSFLDWIAQGS